MTEITSGSEFIKPYFIEELGEEGLCATDIAKSLGIEAARVRRKLEDRGFVERIKAQGFQALPIGRVNEINKLSYTEYLLDTAAAKFFVGKYESDLGDSYLAFLIRLEKGIDELDVLTRNDPLLQQIAATQRLRLRQLQQEKRIEALEVRTEDIHASILNSILSVPQKENLKTLIDGRARSMGSIKFAGQIQKELKEYFNLNATNDKWYHLRQQDYSSACNFVSDWGR